MSFRGRVRYWVVIQSCYNTWIFSLVSGRLVTENTVLNHHRPVICRDATGTDEHRRLRMLLRGGMCSDWDWVAVGGNMKGFR